MAQKSKIYTIAASHLDTSWLWTLETSIDEYIPNTLFRNFDLFEKYPDYKFGFEGSYRYELMEEYYPAAFEKLRKYVADGRWAPVGSSYENGDVNMPSPEALFRNILYGNRYFEEKFGVRSNDIFLPDCFGFGWALPSIAAHAGLKGFSTGKLTWGGAYGSPFDIGKWYGVDGSFVYANTRPSSYSRAVTRIRKDGAVAPKLKENIEKYNLPLTATFYGTGDRGGAPAEPSVKVVTDEMKSNTSDSTEVLSTTSVDLFNDLDKLPDDIKSRMPVWNNELLLTNHGVGSYTSRSVGTRWNKNCERLADYAERGAVTAEYLTGRSYPAKQLDTAWKRFIAHQFHDDITGTSFQECYLRNWNDYLLSQNQFAEEYTGSSAAVAERLDTSRVKGVAVVVNNPLQYDRTESVEAKVSLPAGTKYVSVFAPDGTEVPSQILRFCGEDYTVCFSACVKPLSYSVFDVRASQKASAVTSPLRLSGNTLENDALKVMLNAAGDICEVYFKESSVNALSEPIRFALFDYLGSKAWPAWELTYSELSVPPREYAARASVKIKEFGAARCSFLITKKAGKSTFKQVVSLDAFGEFVRVYNEVDWRSTQSLLKVVFPLAASSHSASYDLGLGVIKRGSNKPNLYEVPAQLWADISDDKKDVGVSVFSDSRAGWDKPGDNTLRLTVVHTPYYSYRWECSQHLMDLGLNRFSFGVFPHCGGAGTATQRAALCFNEPLCTFVSDKHNGEFSDYSFGSVSDPSVILRAVKKSYDGDGVIVRFNEGEGSAKHGVSFTLGNGIASAEEVNACEDVIGGAIVRDDVLLFGMRPFGLRSFKVKLIPDQNALDSRSFSEIKLPCNITAITANDGRALSEMSYGFSIPRELIPDTVTSGGVPFAISRGQKNALVPKGETLYLPAGTKKLHILAFSVNGDKHLALKIDGETTEINIADCFERPGEWDLIGLGMTGRIKRNTLAWNATHIHEKLKDVTAKQLYVFKYTINLPDTARTVTLPYDSDAVILSATAQLDSFDFACATQLYDSLDRREFDYVLTADEVRKARPATIENKVNYILNRKKTVTLGNKHISGTFQVGDGFATIRSFLNK